MTDSTRSPSATTGPTGRGRCVALTAATVVVGLAAGAILSSGGGPAGAAPLPQAQSVGRFLDGAVSGMSLESVANLQDARAMAAPDTSKHQGVNATLFNAAQIPIGDGLKLPGGGVFNVGAANQVAVADTNGFSYGSAGAVANNGGAQLTDDDDAYPADATINLSGAALGSVRIPGLPTSIPGLPTGTGLPIPSATSLGGVVARVGAVQALARTGSGGVAIEPRSSVAGLQLALGSPALGALLTQLDDAFQTNIVTALGNLNPTVGTLLGTLTNFTGCSLTAPTSTTVSLEGGGVVIDPTNATVTIDLKILLRRLLGLNISHLSTSNFDLVKFLVKALPTILSKGLESIVNGITGGLERQFSACSTAITNALAALPIPVTQPPAALGQALTTLQTTLENAINSVADPLISASGGGLATLADGLTGVVDIGLNVQSGPKIQPHDSHYRYSTMLAETPDQATAVVPRQSLVRAVEIDLLDAAGSTGAGSGLPTGLPPLPGTSGFAARQLAGAHRAAAAAGGSVVSLALANAAAGPSTPAVVASPTPTPTPTTVAPTTIAPTAVPTGVPAGAAGHSGGSPVLPIVLLLLGLSVAAGGVVSLRLRGGLRH